MVSFNYTYNRARYYFLSLNIMFGLGCFGFEGFCVP